MSPSQRTSEKSLSGSVSRRLLLRGPCRPRRSHTSCRRYGQGWQGTCRYGAAASRAPRVRPTSMGQGPKRRARRGSVDASRAADRSNRPADTAAPSQRQGPLLRRPPAPRTSKTRSAEPASPWLEAVIVTGIGRSLVVTCQFRPTITAWQALPQPAQFVNPGAPTPRCPTELHGQRGAKQRPPRKVAHTYTAVVDRYRGVSSA